MTEEIHNVYLPLTFSQLKEENQKERKLKVYVKENWLFSFKHRKWTWTDRKVTDAEWQPYKNDDVHFPLLSTAEKKIYTATRALNLRQVSVW